MITTELYPSRFSLHFRKHLGCGLFLVPFRKMWHNFIVSMELALLQRGIWRNFTSTLRYAYSQDYALAIEANDPKYRFNFIRYIQTNALFPLRRIEKITVGKSYNKYRCHLTARGCARQSFKQFPRDGSGHNQTGDSNWQLFSIRSKRNCATREEGQRQTWTGEAMRNR